MAELFPDGTGAIVGRTTVVWGRVVPSRGRSVIVTATRTCCRGRRRITAQGIFATGLVVSPEGAQAVVRHMLKKVRQVCAATMHVGWHPRKRRRKCRN